MRIFRYSDDMEQLALPVCDQAIMMDDQSSEIPAGYGLYLYDARNGQRPTNLPSGGTIHPVSHDPEPGDFIGIHEDRAILLETADRDDRTLFVTGQCNSNCIMCPYTTNQRIRAQHEPLYVLLRCVQLMDSYAPYLCITGGEPTLIRRDFFALLQCVRDHFEDCLVHILTNGRAFCYGDYVRDYRSVRPSRTLLGIPLYGHTTALHDHITQAPGSFEQTLRGLERLYAHGEHIELRIVVSKLNAHALPHLAQMIIDKFPKVYCVSVMGIEMMGNAMIYRDDVWLDFNRSMEIISPILDQFLKSGVQVQLFNFPLCKVQLRHWPIYRKSITLSKVKYLPDCECCAMKPRCGGFFETTAHHPIQVNPFQPEVT